MLYDFRNTLYYIYSVYITCAYCIRAVCTIRMYIIYHMLYIFTYILCVKNLF